MSIQSTGISKSEKRRRTVLPAPNLPFAVLPAPNLPPLEPAAERLIFKAELLERSGLSFPTVWKMMRDGTFPRARVVGGKSAWLSSEIDEWIAALPVRRLKGDE